jgi:hypothetical protein
MVAPHTAGDPMGHGRGLNCRLRDVQERLDEAGHGVSLPVISRLLQKHDYRLRANVKELTSKRHPDRDRQFQHIHKQRAEHMATGQPVLSVDTKKKELVGNFKNEGQIWCQEPEAVSVHGFRRDAMGRAVPYGLYDLQRNQGTVYVGQSADTPAFAVDNIAHWCQTERLAYYPEATQLMIEADGGGSNSCRSRVWKRDLQESVADAFGLTITVCHYPTGASIIWPVYSQAVTVCPKSKGVILSYNLCDRDFTVKRPKAPSIAKGCCQGVQTCEERMISDLQESPDVACANCVSKE